MNKSLNSFRAFAFFAVFLYHLDVLKCGYIGVQAFFVLSGFLITPILLEMKAELPLKAFFKNFYGRRLLRIFPLYYFYIIVVAILSCALVYGLGKTDLLRVNRFLEQLPWAVSYLYDFFHASKYFEHTHLLTHFWSLAVEEQYYLFIPLIIYLLKTKQLKVFLIAMIIISPILRYLISHIVTIDNGKMLLNNNALVVYVLPFSHLDAFAFGGFFALYYKKIPSFLHVCLFFCVAMALGFVSDFISGSPFILSGLGYAAYLEYGLKFVWGYSILNLFFAFLLVKIRDKSFLPSLFENPVLSYLGKISYGLYVYHFPIIWLLSKISLGFFATASLALLFTIMASIASYELMEKRLLKLKDRYFPKTVANK